MKVNEKARNSSIELLRIVAMIMIVFHHFSGFGGFEYDTSTITIPRLWFYFMYMGGKIGVDIFLIISGYFLINDESYTINIKRALKFWGQVVFYSLGLFLIWGITNPSEVTFSKAVYYLTPVTHDIWWFASVYLIIYLLHPFINKMLRGLTKKGHLILVVISLMLWCVIPTLNAATYQGSKLEWGITLYILSAYIGIYGLPDGIKIKHYILVLSGTTLIAYGWAVLMCFIGTKDEKYMEYVMYLFTQEYITTLLIALSLFMIFVNIEIPYIKWVNVLGAATFGVYLFHEHPLIKYTLWQTIFKNNRYQDSLKTIPFSIGVCVLVFLIGAVIDIFRKYTFEKLFMKLISKLPVISLDESRKND